MIDNGGYTCGCDGRVTGTKLTVYMELFKTKELSDEGREVLREFGENCVTIDDFLLGHIEECGDCRNYFVDQLGVDIALGALSRAKFKKLIREMGENIN